MLIARKVKTVPPTALRIHSAANAAKHPATPHLIPAPFRRSHTPHANPLRGIASQELCLVSARGAVVTQPGRGKSQAIEHNRALPKVGQSLRWLGLVAYRCAPFGFG